MQKSSTRSCGRYNRHKSHGSLHSPTTSPHRKITIQRQSPRSTLKMHPISISTNNNHNTRTLSSTPDYNTNSSSQYIIESEPISLDDAVITLNSTSLYDTLHHERRWQSQWNIRRPSPYSRDSNYTPPSRRTSHTHDTTNTSLLSPSYDTDLDLTHGKPAFYSLSMFPYPSGYLHMGHTRVYSISDTLNRYYKLKGYNVIHPMGWDAFGLPAENAARQRNSSPSDWTYKNIKHMRTQMDSLGIDFNWEREVATCHPDYYKWTQWLFLELYHSGLAYRKKATVNWDPIDQTVLANEQVDAEGKSWRSGAIVERKDLDQWFFKITDYADRLLDGIDTLDQWPSTVKVMQSQWIGKKHAAHINFALSSPAVVKNNNNNDDDSTVSVSISSSSSPHITLPSTSSLFTAFTTRPDTLFGVTYVAALPGHNDITTALDALSKHIDDTTPTTCAAKKATTSTPLKTFDGIPITSAWIKQCQDFAHNAEQRRQHRLSTQPVTTAKHRGSKQSKDQQNAAPTDGIRLPFDFIHPLTHQHIPLYYADYVEPGRGTGIVMGVPAHDNNDYDFAARHNIPVKCVITSPSQSSSSSKNKKKKDNSSTTADNDNSASSSVLPNIDPDTGYVRDITQYTPHTTQQGTMIHSHSHDDINPFSIDNMEASEAARHVIDHLTKINKGKAAPSFQIHDWLVSRQRFWGTPIPIIHCYDGCGPQPVPADQLPVVLPEGIPLDVKGLSPLASDHPNAKAWRQVCCPNCGTDNAQRETDTLDTFIDSSWYFLRYLSTDQYRANENITTYGHNHNRKSNNTTTTTDITSEDVSSPASSSQHNDKQKQQARPHHTLPWDTHESDTLYPVTQYIGGIEHAILHLLYSRFISYFLYDRGHVKAEEPFKSLLTQGMVHGESFKDPVTGKYYAVTDTIEMPDSKTPGKTVRYAKNINPDTGEITPGQQLTSVWEKMSKSKNNGIDPDDMIAKYGADVLRLFVLFKAPPEKVLDWDERAVQGISRWITRLSVLTQGVNHAITSIRQDNNNNNPTDDVISTSPSTNGYKPLEDSYDDIINGKVITLSSLPRHEAEALFKKCTGRDMTPDEIQLLSLSAQTVLEVTKAVEQRGFNVGIAKLMTLSNDIFTYLAGGSLSTANDGNNNNSNNNNNNDDNNPNTQTSLSTSSEWSISRAKLSSPVVRESIQTIIKLLAPFAPHFASEQYYNMQSVYANVPYNSALQFDTSHDDNNNTQQQSEQQEYNPSFDVQKLSWPTIDPTWAQNVASAVVQINGKLLFSQDVPSEILDAPVPLQALLNDTSFNKALTSRLYKRPGAHPILTTEDMVLNTQHIDTMSKRVITRALKANDRILVNLVM